MDARLSWLDYFGFILMLVVSALIGIYYGFFKKQDTLTDYLHGNKQMGTWSIAMSLASRLSWLDYFAFILMLVVSALIGIYYGFFKKQDTLTDYLHGNKQMDTWSIAMSLASSTLSGIAMISVPADVYRYGIYLVFFIPVLPITLYIGYVIYLPVFYKLQVTSIYEYFSLRFDKNVRIFASVLYAIQGLLSLPIIIYVPALVLSQATGLTAHFLTPILCGVCVFYTTLGGLRAVVWTDVAQFIVMVSSLFVILIMGIIACGGFGIIFERAYMGGRLDISFDLDVLKRDTFWTASIGNITIWIYLMDVNQGFVQKCLSLPSFRSLKIALCLATIGLLLILGPCMLIGFITFATYFECDPLEQNIIKSYDELVPMFAIDVAQNVPGLFGLFISGVFSAALSTLSAGINCLAATIYQDFISPFVSKSTSQKRISIYLKLIAVALGIFCALFVFVIEHLGNLLALFLSLSGITSGALVGLFSVGMLLPMVNEKGAFCGGITALLTMLWLVITTQWYTLNKMITSPILPVSTIRCNDTIQYSDNQTMINTVQSLASNINHTASIGKPAAIYSISFFWYTTMGILIVLIVSLPVSLFTKAKKPLNKDCINPIAHFLLKRNKERPPKYDTIENALELTRTS